MNAVWLLLNTILCVTYLSDIARAGILTGALADLKLKSDATLNKVGLQLLPKYAGLEKLATKVAANEISPDKTNLNLPPTVRKYTADKYDPSNYEKDHYMGWIHWLQHVPTLQKLGNAAQGIARRTAHSFLNHHEDTLAGISGPLDHMHQIVNGVGKLILPDTRLLDHFDESVEPVLLPHSHLARTLGALRLRRPLLRPLRPFTI